MSVKEYRNLFIRAIYRKPVFIVLTLFGVALLATILLDYLEIIEFYSELPSFEIVCGIIMVSGPLAITGIVVNQFKANPSFRHDLIYNFGENGVHIQGLTYESTFSWDHFLRHKTIGKYLVLYQAKKLGNFVDTTALTSEQLEFIKSKIPSK